MLRRLLVLPALVICLILLTAQGAFAHATVVATTPGDGQTVASAPHQVSVTFDEPVALQFGALRVFSPTGARVDEGSPAHPAGHADEVAVDLASGLKPGTYTTSWRVISADSHPVQGAFTFNIGQASASAVNSATLHPAGSKAVGALYAVARFVAYAAFAVLVGTAVFVFAWWPNGARTRAVRILLVSAWSGLAVATAGVLALQGPYGAGFGLGRALDAGVLRTTLSTRLGEALSGRLALIAFAAALLAWLFIRLPDASRRARILAALAGTVLTVGIAATWAVSGHAGTGIQVALAVPVDVAHLCAMAVWLGGLTVLAAIVLRRGGRGTPGERARMVRHFSPVALTCVIVLVGTGTYQSWRQVGSVPALTGTAYGRLLLLKLLGVILLIGLGYLARRWIARHREDHSPETTDQAAISTLRRSVASEVGLGVCVLALTAALVNAPPARTAFTASAGPVSASATFNSGGPGGTGTIQVTVDPAKTGADTVHLYTLGPTGKQEQVLQVQASFTLASRALGPLQVTLRNAGAGHLIGDAALPIAGTWRLAVTVRTDDLDETTVQIPITIR
ncbi:copper resistance protein CopC/CopD [Catenulispora sp. NF23]|uniref:Copper resistance protein CopC/CopD n=1 Tax=Catenulispora pinistramenti TaxID=2705254 RepID=A0ABS5L1N5_9ACTN|nr:copper resistance protein CopC [Catenulispora pinistramenti]MBS2539949.1 copper resistance protein CopC/CopD [Catenulispora pinistramenti]MBS2552104.1 copper resistance protein CopC/CopD [Catenulispora pinistramenti]